MSDAKVLTFSHEFECYGYKGYNNLVDWPKSSAIIVNLCTFQSSLSVQSARSRIKIEHKELNALEYGAYSLL